MKSLFTDGDHPISWRVLKVYKSNYVLVTIKLKSPCFQCRWSSYVSQRLPI